MTWVVAVASDVDLESRLGLGIVLNVRARQDFAFLRLDLVFVLYI